jgi:thiol-disulfide isomerase/thioredoxin
MPPLSRRCLAALSILLGSAAALPAAELTIGSPAPAIDIEHWVQDGEGKYKPVTEFKKDKVYVVEFWATWCGPCIMSMPHIAQLQADYADKDVQVISISDEDLDTVKEFLERDNGEGETFADVTKGYCLTTDPDKSVYADYMEAAGQNGIPTAFIVGKTSAIRWRWTARSQILSTAAGTVPSTPRSWRRCRRSTRPLPRSACCSRPTRVTKRPRWSTG